MSDWKAWGADDSCPYTGEVEVRMFDLDYATRFVRPASEELDPNGTDAHAPGAKLDAGKTRAWLFLAGFSRALEEVAKVTTEGAKKYTPNGWASVPNGEERYMDAFGRHMLAYGSGERVDEQIQCLHKAQMIWNLLAALELELRREDSGLE